MPAELTGLVSGVTGDLPLRPIARLQTARTVRHLRDNAGQILAEVADDQVTGSLPEPGGAAGSWQVASTWREVEVELDHGAVDLLADTRQLLLAAGAEPSPAASKLSNLLTTAGALPGGTDPRSPHPG